MQHVPSLPTPPAKKYLKVTIYLKSVLAVKLSSNSIMRGREKEARTASISIVLGVRSLVHKETLQTSLRIIAVLFVRYLF